ncbi:MAG: aspartyl protease family protein [Treponema sp.]|nr:aspartyl protease family protein [Treponema sp.]
MGEVYEEITLKNGADLTLASNGHIINENIRSVTVTALVDTGAMTLVIGNELRKKLGLAVVGARAVTLAGGSKVYCSIAEPVEIGWKDRTSLIRPWVLPDEKEVLLGVIPLEEMDLIVDPVNKKLVGAHGDEMMGKIK